MSSSPQHLSVRRPPSRTLPNAKELGLVKVPHFGGSSSGLPLLGEIPASPRIANEGSASVGDSSPLFYNAPLPVSTGSPPLSVRRPSFYVSGGLLSRGPSTGKFIDLDKHPVFSNSSTGDIISADEVASSTPGIRGAELVAVSQEKNNNPLEHLTLILEYGIRFSVHIVLLSVFESLFFWKFVSVSEDDALNKLVNGYIEGTLDSCPRWNATERFIVSTFVDLLFNKTSIDKAGVSAANERNAFNAILFRNSWVYVACLAALLIVLCVWALIRKRHVPWTHIFLENLALIVILGLYEFLFFRTIVLVYRAVSGAELDSQLLNKFVAQCQNGTWWAGRSA